MAGHRARRQDGGKWERRQDGGSPSQPNWERRLPGGGTHRPDVRRETRDELNVRRET